MRISFIFLLLLALAACGQQPAQQQPTPVAANTVAPTVQPSATSAPTAEPTAEPTPAPTAAPTAAPTPAPTATPEPTPAPEVIGYAAHVVQEGETLESIAADGGSDAQLIASYNLLKGAIQPGRELIVPQLAGTTSAYGAETPGVFKGNTQRPYVALTLDAGASGAPTGQILQTLRERNVRITFFLTGRWMQENPDLLRQMVADGHELANHSLTHASFFQLSDAEIVEELRATEAIFHEIAGPDATIRPYFRFPFGDGDDRTEAAVIAEGYLPIYWTFDSLDSIGEPKSAAFLVERITGYLTPEELPGAIILAHCGSQPTADALPEVLDRFEAMGFEVRPLSDVLGE